MKKGEILYNLIKRLSKSEKRYFKRFAQLVGSKDEKDYLVVFDLLEKQKIYNEKGLRNKLGELKVKRPIANIESYLLDKLLNALSQYHRNTNSIISYRSEVEKAYILLCKGLYSASYESLTKVGRLPEGKKPLYSSYMYALLYESISYAKATTPECNVELEAITDSWLKHIEAQKAHITYLNLLAKAQKIFYLQDHNHKEEKIKKFQKLLAHPYIVNDEHCLTFTCKVNRLYCLFYSYSYLKNYTALYQQSKELLEQAFEELPNKGLIHLEIWGTYLEACIYNKDEKTFIQEATIFDEYAQINPALEARHAYLKDYYYTLAAIHYNNPMLVLSKKEQIQNTLATYPNQINEYQAQVIYLNVGISYLVNEQYDQGLQWLNQWLLNKKRPLENQYFFPFILLYIIMNMANENYYLANRMIDLRKRQLKKKENYPESLKKIFEYLKRINNIQLKSTISTQNRLDKTAYTYNNLLQYLDDLEQGLLYDLLKQLSKPFYKWVQSNVEETQTSSTQAKKNYKVD